MQPIISLYGLSYHTNMTVHHFRDKYIVLYDDHRCILNVLFEAKKLKLFDTSPNLIFFDRHDDACNPYINKSELFEKWGVKKIEDVSNRDFWSFVEFDLNSLDDDWLLAGMELDLINHAVVIGQNENSNMRSKDYTYVSTDGKLHEMYDIPHLNNSISSRGCLGDSIIKQPYYKKVRDIFEYNQPPCGRYNKFSDKVTHPFVLDFDLDCFTTECENKTFAWPEDIFRQNFYENDDVDFFMQQLIERSSFITICREPECCGRLGESNKILGYLDNYFFKGCLGTSPIL